MENVFEQPRILVVAAHIGDFVWRCGGSIAKYTRAGSEVRLIVLSDGLRGEANDYWKTPDANENEGHAHRRKEGLKAAEILGIGDVELWDLQDYPMPLDNHHVEKLAHAIRSFRPNIILTHSDYDAFNPDHNAVHTLVRRACATSSADGFRDGLAVAPRQTPIFGFEPHMTECSDFKPAVYVDITDSFDTKCQAMQAFASQPKMYKSYVRKAETRGGEAASRGSRKGCQYAEAFAVFQPIAASGGFVW